MLPPPPSWTVSYGVNFKSLLQSHPTQSEVGVIVWKNFNLH